MQSNDTLNQSSVDELYDKFMQKIKQKKPEGSEHTPSKSTNPRVRHTRQFSFQKGSEYQQNRQNDNKSISSNPINHQNDVQRDLLIENPHQSIYDKYSPQKSLENGKTASFSPIRNNLFSPNGKIQNFGSTNRSNSSGGFMLNNLGISPINSQGVFQNYNSNSQVQNVGNNKYITPNFLVNGNIQPISATSTSRAYSNAMNALQERIKLLDKEKEEQKQKSIQVFQEYEQELAQTKIAYEQEIQDIKNVENILKDKVEKLENILGDMSKKNKHLILNNSDIQVTLKHQYKNNDSLEDKLVAQQKKFQKQIEIQQEDLQYMNKWKEDQKVLYQQLLKDRDSLQQENTEILLKCEMQKEEIYKLKIELEEKTQYVEQSNNIMNAEKLKLEYLNKEIFDTRGDYNKQLQDFQGELMKIEMAYKQQIQDLENENLHLIEENKKGVEFLSKREQDYNNLEQKYFRQKERFSQLKQQVMQLRSKCNACTKVELKKMGKHSKTTSNLSSTNKKYTPSKKTSDNLLDNLISSRMGTTPSEAENEFQNFNNSSNSNFINRSQYQIQHMQQLYEKQIQREAVDDGNRNNLTKTDQKYKNSPFQKHKNQGTKTEEKAPLSQQHQNQFINQIQVPHFNNAFSGQKANLSKSYNNGSQILQTQQQQLYENNISLNKSNIQNNSNQAGTTNSRSLSSVSQRNLLNNIVKDISKDKENSREKLQQSYIEHKQQLQNQSIKKQIIQRSSSPLQSSNNNQNTLETAQFTPIQNENQNEKWYQQQQQLDLQYQQLQQRYQQQMVQNNTLIHSASQKLTIQTNNNNSTQPFHTVLSSNILSEPNLTPAGLNSLGSVVRPNSTNDSIHNNTNINNNSNFRDLQLVDLDTNKQQTPQNQDQKQSLELILKMIIDTERIAVDLNKQYQNLFAQSQVVSDVNKKSEYRGRLIELNEQIKKTNDKLYILKKKEHQALGQI